VHCSSSPLRKDRLTAKQFHYAFGNTLTEEESDALRAAWTIPGAGRPMFEGAGANFSRHSPAKVDTHKADRGPLLLTSGTEDHTVPLKVTKRSRRDVLKRISADRLSHL
jgi:hypothetical protein